MILIDNTVLSNFALIYHPDALQQAFRGEIGTTDQVFHELERGVQCRRLPEYSWTWLQRLHLTEAETVQFHQFAKHLGAGEASCLAMAVHRAYQIATDDKDARKWAVRLTIPHTGTLGILAVLVKQGAITLLEANTWLQQMIEKGYHSPLQHIDILITS